MYFDFIYTNFIIILLIICIVLYLASKTDSHCFIYECGHWS